LEPVAVVVVTTVLMEHLEVVPYFLVLPLLAEGVEADPTLLDQAVVLAEGAAQTTQHLQHLLGVLGTHHLLRPRRVIMAALPVGAVALLVAVGVLVLLVRVVMLLHLLQVMVALEQLQQFLGRPLLMLAAAEPVVVIHHRQTALEAQAGVAPEALMEREPPGQQTLVAAEEEEVGI